MYAGPTPLWPGRRVSGETRPSTVLCKEGVDGRPSPAMTKEKGVAIRRAGGGPVDELVDEKSRARRVSPGKGRKHG